jgi:hypothetical protein
MNCCRPASEISRLTGGAYRGPSCLGTGRFAPGHDGPILSLAASLVRFSGWEALPYRGAVASPVSPPRAAVFSSQPDQRAALGFEDRLHSPTKREPTPPYRSVGHLPQPSKTSLAALRLRWVLVRYPVPMEPRSR